MRTWVKLFQNNHMLKDITIEDYSGESRTHKVMNALEKACLEFDLEKPIWLESTIADFKRTAKTRFTRDCFIESVEFDYLELHVIEEDY
ncbi:MAG: hypothetical protein J5626_08385 [Lachnospiraceae bacterium]|nr:hypothetical protein [Lachnospiraceae bacterium]